MKKTLTAAALALAILALPLTAALAQDARPLTERQMELIEKNVLANLESPSMEVRAGTMQTLIELKKAHPSYDVSYAVLPMMETLKHDDKPAFRILAALTLYHLDSELGRFAVERRAQYDDSPRVARHCAALVRNWGRATYSTDLLAEVSRVF
jgi:hypothetical protein